MASKESRYDSVHEGNVQCETPNLVRLSKTNILEKETMQIPVPIKLTQTKEHHKISVMQENGLQK